MKVVLMNGRKCIAYWLAAAALCASPTSVAAQEYWSPLSTSTRSAAFVGAQARLRFGGAKVARPVARLTAGMTNLSFDQRGILMKRSTGSTYELGLSRTGRPDFYIGGQRYSDVRTKLGIAPIGAALMTVGGLVVVGAALAGSSDKEKNEEKPPEVVCMGIGVCPPLTL